MSDYDNLTWGLEDGYEGDDPEPLPDVVTCPRCGRIAMPVAGSCFGEFMCTSVFCLQYRVFRRPEAA